MKKILLGLVLLCVLLTIPSVIERVQVEHSANEYEVVVPLIGLEQWVDTEPDTELPELLSDLKNAGVQSVAVEPETLRTLQADNEVTVFTTGRINEMIVLNGLEPLTDERFKEGIFLYAEDLDGLEKRLLPIVEDSQIVTVDDISLLHIAGNPTTILNSVLGYDDEKIKLIKEAGLTVVPRLSNSTEPAQLKRLEEALLELKDDQVRYLLFSGTELPYANDPAEVVSFSERMNEAGFSFFWIEFAGQKGMMQAAYASEFSMTRLHSLPLTLDNQNVISERIARAVKERNIRAIYLNLPSDPSQEVIPELATILADADQQLASSFSQVASQPFPFFESSKWQVIIALIGSGMFLAYSLYTFYARKPLVYIIAGSTLLAAIGYLVTGSTMILKFAALGIAITAPTYAVLATTFTERRGYYLVNYLIALGYTFIGIWFVVVLLNGSPFLTGIDQFRGVKLVYIIPMVAVALFAFWSSLKKLFVTQVRYWHLVVIAVIGTVAFYYLSRTGNAGSVSTYELMVRQWLEQLLYVRPRTKEFLIGFPLFLLALYAGRSSKMLAFFLMIPASIGFLSVVNTFTHLHIPLHVSLLRTVYSVTLGFAIGMLAIYLYDRFIKLYVKRLKMRWNL